MISTSPSRAGANAALSDLANAQLSERQLRSRVVSLAWPSVADNLLATMVNIVAMVMVGSLGSTAIAAVGISNQLVWLAYVLFMALGVGSTALVARAIGAGKQAEANAVARQGIMFGCVLALAAGAAGMAWARGLLGMMTTDLELIRLALPHMRISMATTVLAAVSFGLAAVLRGAGDMRSPMIANGVANACNVVFLYAFINGKLGAPALGVAGAAVGASLARLVSCLILLWVVVTGRTAIRFSVRDSWRPNGTVIKRIANVGLPSAIEQGLMNFGMLMFARLVVGIGTTFYAAHQIAVSVASLSFMPGQGFAAAATTLVGQCLGAGRSDLAERFATSTQRLGAMVMTAMGLMFFLLGGPAARLYTSDPQVVAMTAMALRYAAFSQLPNSVYFIYAGALRGAGDTKWPLYISFLGVWGVRLNLARYLIGSLGWGLLGVWVAIFCDMLVRAAVVGWRFRGGRWKTVRV